MFQNPEKSIVASDHDIKGKNDQENHTELEDDEMRPAAGKHLEISGTHHSDAVGNNAIGDTQKEASVQTKTNAERPTGNKPSALGMEHHKSKDEINTKIDTLGDDLGMKKTSMMSFNDRIKDHMKSSEYPALDLSDESNLEEDLELAKS